jgi:hypothetical protein
MVPFRRTYTVKEKLRLVRESEGLTLQEAKDRFNVSTSSMSLWRSQGPQLEQVLLANKENVPFRLGGAGRPRIISDETSNELIVYFDERRDNLDRVDVRLMLTKLRQIDPDVNQIIEESRGSLAVRSNMYKRIHRILKKHNIGKRRTTHQAQNTRMNQDMIDGFGKYIIEKMKMLLIDHDCIANFDETNVYFSPDIHTTLDRRGSKTVSVRSGTSSQRCTVMIGVSGDGQRFPPYIIFTGKYTNTGTINQTFQRITAEQQRYNNNIDLIPPESFLLFPFRSFYTVQARAWMDSIHMLDWIDKVWRPWTITKNKPTMLILDEFCGHMTAEVRNAIVQCGTHLEFIPAGYTSKLQVMDVGFNKPFKDGFRHQFDSWITGRVEKPRRHHVATWIQASWEGMSCQRIARNTWRRIGIPQPEEVPPIQMGDVPVAAPLQFEAAAVPIQGTEDEDAFNIVVETAQEFDEELDQEYYNTIGDAEDVAFI